MQKVWCRQTVLRQVTVHVNKFQNTSHLWMTPVCQKPFSTESYVRVSAREELQKSVSRTSWNRQLNLNKHPRTITGRALLKIEIAGGLPRSKVLCTYEAARMADLDEKRKRRKASATSCPPDGGFPCSTCTKVCHRMDWTISHQKSCRQKLTSHWSSDSRNQPTTRVHCRISVILLSCTVPEWNS